MGRTGLGPSRFVFCGAGGGEAHVCVGPQPKFPPETRRFTSSLQLGPFSVTNTRPVVGWKARPNMFRCPYVKMKLSWLRLP
jgi:hypothetical protein